MWYGEKHIGKNQGEDHVYNLLYLNISHLLYMYDYMYKYDIFLQYNTGKKKSHVIGRLMILYSSREQTEIMVW